MKNIVLPSPMKLSVALIGTVGLLSCSHGSKTADTPAAPSRAVVARTTSGPMSIKHAPDGKSGYQLPPYEEKRLGNGLRLIFIHDDKLPSINYSLLIKVGGIQDPDGLSGLTSMVAELLDKGSKKHSAPQLAGILGQMGAEFDSSAAIEFSVVSASGLSTQADALLDTMLEIVTEPTFSDIEIERVRKQTLSAIDRLQDSPDAFSEQAFTRFLFGDHPYARPLMGNAQTVAAIKKKHIIQQYLHFYRPNNSILAVVGKFTPELQARIEKVYGAWQPREVAPAKLGAEPKVEGLQIELVDKPGLVQAQIHIGNDGIARQDPDFVTLRLANTILGGAFASRLVDRVRKELGLTYSIGSSFDARLEPGPFQISTFTKNNSIAQTVTETIKVLHDFREKGVNQAEVERAKGYLKGIFPTAIETSEKLAFNLMLLRFYDIEDTYLTGYLDAIDHLTADQVNVAIKKHIDDKNLKVLVYTSAAEATTQLQDVAKNLGGTLIVKKASEAMGL